MKLWTQFTLIIISIIRNVIGVIDNIDNYISIFLSKQGGTVDMLSQDH